MADVLIVCETDMLAADRRRRAPEGVRTTYVGGSLLGSRFDLIIVCPFDDRQSKTERERFNTYINENVLCRLKPGGMILYP